MVTAGDHAPAGGDDTNEFGGWCHAGRLRTQTRNRPGSPRSVENATRGPAGCGHEKVTRGEARNGDTPGDGETRGSNSGRRGEAGRGAAAERCKREGRS